MNSSALHVLLNAHSVSPKYHTLPAPSEAHLDMILRAAMSAPDHGNLQPWRLMLVRGEALARLGDLFATSFAQRNPQASESMIERERGKPQRSPLLILLVSSPKESDDIPQWEQQMSLAAAATHMQLMAQSLGYGSVWLSGDRCQDRWLLDQLGLAAHEQLLGYLAIGTCSENCTAKVRDNPWLVTQEWSG